MGYSTDFEGKLKFNKQLSVDDLNFLRKLAGTRRMKRKVDPKYGVDGEFYVDGTGEWGQGRDDNVVDYNTPPETQPSLWLQWEPTEDGWYLEWNGGEKFYSYIEWLEYLIEKILKPRGYVLNGVIDWQGEESDDRGIIDVKDNFVMVNELKNEDIPYNVSEHQVWEVIGDALETKLGLKYTNAGVTNDEYIEREFGKENYKVTIRIGR